MPLLTAIYGEKIRSVQAPNDGTIGDAIALTGLPLEQPCAGRGTCGKCKVLVESGAAPPDDIEKSHLTPGELALNNRLACRARIESDVQVLLAPIEVYSNKVFRTSHRYKRTAAPLGLAIDLGSTTVAAFLTILDNGEVCAGGASLNQQTVYGADVISRLAAARSHPENAERLHRLAVASINQAVDSLNLPERIRKRIQKVTVVGNVAMHHLLCRLPVDTIAVSPFQPVDSRSNKNAASVLDGLFSDGVEVTLPPLIGGFVGSDALACLAYFNFDHPTGPMAAIDLGTNGEVMVTDGRRILTASTAAGPAFEGVFISCGSRAINGAIIKAQLTDGSLKFKTIGDEPAIGLTGSGLLSLVSELVDAGVVSPNGRLLTDPLVLRDQIGLDRHGSRQLKLVPGSDLGLTQWDIRELQKAKGAVRASIDILMHRLDLQPSDLERVILTGSFGAQVDMDAVIRIGMIPPVKPATVEAVANGAGFGAALFLTDEGFALGEELAAKAEQVDLDQDVDFVNQYIAAMELSPQGRNLKFKGI